MLSVKNIFAGYGNITVLKDVTFHLNKNNIIGVLGRNGMGKSTLIRVLSGLILPSKGVIELMGENITNYAPHVRAQKRITTIVQGRGIFPKLSVYENLLMGMISQKRKINSRLDEVFSYFPIISNRLHQTAGTLSGGEQQMLAIGRAIMTDPEIMLLDEPSDGIMPALVDEITNTLKKINQTNNISMIIVEQNVPMIFSLTDNCIILEKGRIVISGKKSDVENSQIMKQYLAI
jgi:branched-chain amino acid transport system ATP-binding protein|tara:strand:- start:1578 stop:2276 length:699 start_codon:yes stop_codon:yes gene_type:complete